MYLKYGKKEIEFLKKTDPKLSQVIDQIGLIKREREEDFFSAVIHHIIGQQISMKAQKTIWNRFLDHFSPVLPKSIEKIPKEEMKALGISYRKAEYILEFAHKVHIGELDLEKLKREDNNQVMIQLTALNGIGPWTAEMLMIFALGRKDIFSYGDLAIKKGLCILHGYEKIDKKIFEKYRKLYSPYGTIASFYLWEVAKNR